MIFELAAPSTRRSTGSRRITGRDYTEAAARDGDTGPDFFQGMTHPDGWIIVRSHNLPDAPNDTVGEGKDVLLSDHGEIWSHPLQCEGPEGTRCFPGKAVRFSYLYGGSGFPCRGEFPFHPVTG